MTSTLYLLHYNNYFNRVVKREETVRAYNQYGLGPPIQVVNFNPNNYIDTTQVVNWNNDDPDYLVEVQDNEINTRWFILSTERTSAGQLLLTLRRDLVADFYSPIIQAPCFIEKALPQSIRDPSIYNSENMTFNQIKQREQLLFDETHCPWIVGYVPRDAFETDTTVTLNAQLSGSADITVEHLTDYPYYQYNNSVVSGKVTNPTIRIGVTYWCMQRTQTGAYVNYYYGNSIKLDEDGNYIGTDRGTGNGGIYGYWWQETYSNLLHVPSNQFTDSHARTVVSKMTTLKNEFHNLSDYVETSITPAEYDKLLKDKGKVIYESSSGKYFKINIEGSQGSAGATRYIDWNSSLGINMRNAMVKDFDGHTLKDPINPTAGGSYNPFSFTSDTSFQTLKIEPIEVKLSVKVPAKGDRYKVSESPYDMFCIPYSDNLTIKKAGQVYVSKTNKSVAITLAQEIISKVGENNIYDIQLLPYCPVRYCIKSNGEFDIGSASYTDIKADQDTVSVLLWATTDNFSFNISVNIPEEQSVVEKKIKSQTDFIRIVSSNFSNSFEMDPQMNEGLDYVTVLCHYKPFNPYIKVQPNFKGLYGTNYNDARGLICNGDFSLAQVTSAWANYELQNKNYNAMFNRQMENLKVNNAIQREKEVWSAVAGGMSGATTGAAGGAMVGSMFGPIGTAVGAGVGLLAGGISSAIGGAKDVQLNDKLRAEALDYTRDMYEYNLGNIKALPMGLAKTSAISPDNKYVPFIEFYSCTDKEKSALRNKITYNGATIMLIDRIQNYLQYNPTYIKGRLIRVEGIDEDFHILAAIAEEIYKGVFISDLQVIYDVNIDDETLEAGDMRYDLTEEDFSPGSPSDGAVGQLRSGQYCRIFEQYDGEDFSGYYIIIQ